MASKIYSMTGFGRHERRIGGRYLTVEVRSVNNRYTEVGIRTPRWLSAYEGYVRETVKNTIDRGKIDVVVFCPDSEVPITHVVLNRSRAKEYIGALSDLAPFPPSAAACSPETPPNAGGGSRCPTPTGLCAGDSRPPR